MQDKLKKILGNEKIIIPFIVVIVVAILILILLSMNKITKLEQIKIEEKSAEISNYFDELTESDDDGKYLNFAIEYLYNTQNDNLININDIVKVINSNFDLDYNKEKIVEFGITSSMHEKGISYDTASESFVYSNSKTISDIASTKIYYFKINKISKVSKNKFKVVYDKFVVENPYEIYNYYNNNNVENFDDKEKQVDTSIIVGYLKGTEKVGAVKDIIRDENNTKFGSEDGKVTITYIIKNDKLIVKKIG